jgi:hypothetical protein
MQWTVEVRDDMVVLDRLTPADVDAHAAGEDGEQTRPSRGVLRTVGFVEAGTLRERGRLGAERRDMVLFSLLPSDL